MGGKFRRLCAALAVIGGVTSAGIAAGPAAAAGCDGPRLVGIEGFRGAEGTARDGFTRFDFTVSSSGCPQDASLRYETASYTAGKDDFVAQAGELLYRAGDDRVRLVSVLVVADGQAERAECFSVQLSVAAGQVKVDPAEAAGVIVDDDAKAKSPVLTRGFHCSE